MSRPLNVVATLISLQADVATASEAVLMLRPLVFSSSIHGCLTWSFCRAQLVLPSITLPLQLEFCRHDLSMNFHCCKGFTTSGPLILVRLSYCIVSSANHISNVHPPSAFSTVKIYLSLDSLLHSSLVSYFIFLHINQSFFDKNQSEKWTEH